MGQLERSGCIADYTHIWWDIRLHPRLGTVEIRICDAVTRVEDAVAIAAYCQALVKQLCERYEAGEEIPSYHRILTSENKWLAARYGLEAPVMDLATGSRNRIPVARLIRRTVGGFARTRRARLRAGARGRARDPRSRLVADRQLRVYSANRDIVEVAREIADATEACPRSRLAPVRSLQRLRVDESRPARGGFEPSSPPSPRSSQAQRHLLRLTERSGRSMQNASPRAVSSAWTNGSCFGRAYSV